MARARLQLKGFKKLQNTLDPKKIQKRTKKHVGKATLKNGLIAEKKIKDAINKGRVRSGRGSRNADLTVAIKGSDRPLVDSGDLVKSITALVKAWDLVLVGIVKDRPVVDQRTGQKRRAIVIARALHEGAEINVTAKMRQFFFWMANSDDSPFKGTVKPLKPSTKKIIIPPKPFLATAIPARAIKRYMNNWNKAVGKILQGKG